MDLREKLRVDKWNQWKPIFLTQTPLDDRLPIAIDILELDYRPTFDDLRGIKRDISKKYHPDSARINGEILDEGQKDLFSKYFMLCTTALDVIVRYLESGDTHADHMFENTIPGSAPGQEPRQRRPRQEPYRSPELENEIMDAMRTVEFYSKQRSKADK